MFFTFIKIPSFVLMLLHDLPDKEKSTICKYDSNNKEHVISIFDDIEVQQVWHKRFKIYYIDNAEIKFIRNLLANKQIEVREDNGKVYKKR